MVASAGLEPERERDDVMMDERKPEASTTHAFHYTVPSYWEGSRLPAWLQVVVTNVFVFTVSHYNLWLLPAAGVLYLLASRGAAWLVAIVVAAYLPSFLNGAPATAHGRPWDAFRKSRLWNIIASDYLRIKVIREAPLDASQKYIFGYHPHGILVLSRFAVAGGNWEALFPGIDFRCTYDTA
jgi:hypothetical protein